MTTGRGRENLVEGAGKIKEKRPVYPNRGADKNRIQYGWEAKVRRGSPKGKAIERNKNGNAFASLQLKTSTGTVV